MSAINSAGGLSQLLQGITAKTSATSNSSSGSSTSTLAGLLQQIGHHKHAHGTHGGFDKLAKAITTALQSASNGDGGSTATDANQTITEALTKIFKNGSIGGTSDSDADQAGSPAASNTAITGTSTASATNGTLPTSFLETLKSFGVTPQQFQSDFVAALKSAQDGGTINASSVFKSFPVGSIVDSIG